MTMPSSCAARPAGQSAKLWIHAAWAVWTILIVALAVYAHYYPRSHTVYDVYSAAARRWAAGEAVYVRVRDYYRYSPLFAAALAPVAALNDEWGAVVWKLINCTVYLLGLGAWTRRMHASELSRAQTAAVFLLVLPMSLHSLHNSQANLMMLGSLLLALASAGAQRWNSAAGWLAWATLLKGYPLAFALLLAALFPRRFAWRYLVALGVGLLLPFSMQRPEVVAWQYSGWFSHMFDSTQIMRERVRGLDWLATIYFQPFSERTYLALEVAGGGLLLAFLLWLRRRIDEPRQLLSTAFDFFALWVVLLGPATEACTYIVAAPTIALALVRAWARPDGRAARWALVAALVMMGPLVTDMFGPAVRNFAINQGSQPLGALVLLGYLMRRGWVLGLRSWGLGRHWSWQAVARPGSFERRSTLAWLALVLAVWSWVDVRRRAEIDVDRPWEHQTDLTVYTEAGAAFFDGRPPYEVANLRGWRYLYAPLFAMLLAPLHHFDPPTQALIWFAISVVLAWGCLVEVERLAVRCLAPSPSDGERRVLLPALVAAGLFTAVLPTLNCLQRGQLGVLKLFLLLVGFRLVCDARGWPKAVAGGAALALAVVLKITPLVPAGIVVGQLALHAWFHPTGPWARVRAAGAAAGLGLGLVVFFFALPAAMVGWNANLRHLETWRREVLFKFSDAGHDEFAGNPHTLRNQSLGNAVYRMGTWLVYELADGPDDRRLDEFGYSPGTTPMDAPVVGRALTAARLALLALLVLVAARMARNGDGASQAVGFGLACVASLLVSPVARAHYFMLWLPGVIAAPIWLWRRGRPRAAFAVAATPSLLILLHYLAMPVTARVGLLGFGTTAWFLATIRCTLDAPAERHCPKTALGVESSPATTGMRLKAEAA